MIEIKNAGLVKVGNGTLIQTPVPEFIVLGIIEKSLRNYSILCEEIEIVDDTVR